MSMLATYYGHAIFPNEMDDWLTSNAGYAQADMYRNDAFAREFPSCSFDGVDSFPPGVPAQTQKLDQYLAEGKPVVIELDFDHDPSDGLQTHFVLVVGKNDQGEYVINDPWYGDQITLNSRYGAPEDAIYQINYFSGPVPQIAPSSPIPAPDPTPGDDANALKVLHDHFATSTDLDGKPFGNLEGYANTLTQDAYQAWKNTQALEFKLTQTQSDLVNAKAVIADLQNKLTTAPVSPVLPPQSPITLPTGILARLRYVLGL